jgi:hypothetical protein
MSDSSGAQGPSTLVLRISVPAGAEYLAIVKELAAKVAAYLGDTESDGHAAATALDQVAQEVKTVAPADAAGPGSHEEIIFEFRQTADALLIRARAAGRSADAWRPLTSQT